MPTYNVKNTKTEEVIEVHCTYNELEAMCNTGEWEKMLSTPAFVTQVNGTLSRTSNNFRDRLKEIKKTSGEGNTIKV
tara:strand:+ start:819 stop:1049 length:231 start_codon:yes stop_codon:yes gene_type:complete